MEIFRQIGSAVAEYAAHRVEQRQARARERQLQFPSWEIKLNTSFDAKTAKDMIISILGPDALIVMLNGKFVIFAEANKIRELRQKEVIVYVRERPQLKTPQTEGAGELGEISVAAVVGFNLVLEPD